MAEVTAAARIPNEDLIERMFATYGIKPMDENDATKFVLTHIDGLEKSTNDVVARSGFVLRRAYEGFGIGYRIPLAIIAVGQSLLGVNLAVTVPAVSSNPLAVTCAAIGAVYYGFSALSDSERQEMLSKVADGMNFGVELVRSIIEFCINALRSLMDGETLAALKAFVTDVAKSFGVTIADITGALGDKITSLASRTYENAGQIAWSTKETIENKAISIWPKSKADESSSDKE